MNHKSINEKLSNFIAEDGNKWEGWHFSAPLFEDFYIIGPKSFGLDPKPTILYHFPEETKGDQSFLHKFVFVDGLHWENISAKTDQEAEFHLSSEYSEREEIVVTRTEAGKTTFIYCLRFRGSAFTRPAIKDEELLEDAAFYRKTGLLPSCKFAFCFVSIHPFHSLLFPFLNLLLDIEIKYRISAMNLYTVARNAQYRKSGVGADIVYWPESTVDFRTACLKQLYTSILPTFGEQICFCFAGSRPTYWKMPKRQDVDFQFAEWGIKALLDWISLADFLTLLAFLLTENYIAVVGSNVEQISKCVTVLPHLIRPFFWTCPVISLLPADLTDILDSPIPTILGLHLRYSQYAPASALIIDLDHHKLILPQDSPAIKLPRESTIASLLAPLWESRINEMPLSVCTTVLRITFEFITDSLVKPNVNALVTKVTEEGTIGTIFIPEVFYSFFSQSDKDFLDRIMETQLFMGAREQLCLMKTQYTDLSQEKLSHLVTQSGIISSHNLNVSYFSI